MSNGFRTFGISAKEIEERYPALGGYQILCHLIMEGFLRPFKFLKQIGNGEYEVASLNYQLFGVCRQQVLGKPVGKERITAWDKYPYDEGEIIDTDKFIFEAEAIENLIALYPDILDFEGTLFSIDPESGEIVHALERSSSTLPHSGPKSQGDLTNIFLEKKELRNALKKAKERIATLEQEVAALKDGGGPNKQTQAAREKQANNTAQSWAKRLELAVVLAANLVNRWDRKHGDEPWAKDGFTNKEIKQVADELGDLSQRGVTAFKKGFIRAFPEVLVKKDSGSRRS